MSRLWDPVVRRLDPAHWEVIELPQVPVQVTEHAYIARACPQCQRRWVPSAELDEVVMGQQRLGINLVSLIAALREEARLPFRTIQWYLAAVHGLRLSVGAIVAATQRAADRAQGMMTDIVERIRGSPVVHADETGWREDGHNGYVWTFSTPTQRYFPHATSCGGDAAKPWWTKSWAMSLLACWSATSMPPTTTMTAPSSAAGHICCETSTTSASSAPTISRWSSGRKPSSNSTNRPKPSPTPQSNGQSSSDAPPNWPWNVACCRCAVPTGMTRRRRRPDCADAWRTTSRACPALDAGNSSSSWLIRRCRLTTTPPSAACAQWWSAARSAAAPAHPREPKPRWRWPQSSALGEHKAPTSSPPADNSSLPLNSELLPIKYTCLPPGQKRRFFGVTIYHPEYARARERNRTAAYRRESVRRKTIAEGTFASLDRLGWEKSRLRGLWKVDCEGYMAALAHNVLKMIRKLGRGVGPPGPMAPADAIAANAGYATDDAVVNLVVRSTWFGWLTWWTQHRKPVTR